MEIRRARLDDHVEYFIDGASEANEIDGCTAVTLRLYGDPIVTRNIVDANHPGKGWRGRCQNGIELSNYASTLLARLPAERRGALIYGGLASLHHMIRELAKVLADWGATDETEGGAMKPFLRKRSRLQGDGSIFHRTARRIHSPSWIRRYIKQNESGESRHLRTVAKIAFDRIGLTPADTIRDGFAAIRADLNLQLEWQRQDYVPRPEVQEARNRVLRGTAAGIPKDRRKILKRAAVLAAGILGASTVSALARGEPIAITGPTVALQVQKRTSLASLGHGHLSVAVTDHSGAHLADLCVYFDKTPALDQVTGLALWMKAGLEAELIEKANITSMGAAGYAHPLFEARQKNNQLLFDALMRSPWHGSTWEAHRQRVDDYWKATGAVWTEALAVFVLGARMQKSMRINREAAE